MIIIIMLGEYKCKVKCGGRGVRSKSCCVMVSNLFAPVIKPKLADFPPTPFNLLIDDSNISLRSDNSILSLNETQISESNNNFHKRNSQKRPKISILNLLKSKRKESSKSFQI